MSPDCPRKFPLGHQAASSTVSPAEGFLGRTRDSRGRHLDGHGATLLMFAQTGNAWGQHPQDSCALLCPAGDSEQSLCAVAKWREHSLLYTPWTPTANLCLWLSAVPAQCSVRPRPPWVPLASFRPVPPHPPSLSLIFWVHPSFPRAVTSGSVHFFF